MRYVSNDGLSEIDPEKSIYLGIDPYGPKAIIADRHIIRNASMICDVCRRPVYLRVCPFCHNMIPPGADDLENKLFVILGSKGSGKSHYLAVLINQLKENISKEFNGVLIAATDSTALRYRDIYYHRLFIEKKKLSPTKSLFMSSECCDPMIFHFRLFDGSNPKVYTLIFFDVSGDDLISSEKMISSNISSFIYKASGIIYIIDPLQIKYINDRIKMNNKPPPDPDVSDILGNICRVIRTNLNIKPKDRIDIPLAVCMSKSDILFRSSINEEENKVLFDISSSLYTPRGYGYYDKENFEQIDIELKEYFERCIGRNFIQMVNEFKRHCYFAVSAIGYNPINGDLLHGIYPMRVEDPFIWMINTNKINK